MELENPRHGGSPNSPPPPHSLSATEGFSSSASTPFVSAPSSPSRAESGGGGGGGYFFSCPASPVHYVLSSAPYPLSYGATSTVGGEASASGSFEFDGAPPDGTMISADELFLNGQIRPLKLSSHLIQPKPLAPLLDIDDEDEDDDDDDDAQAKEATGEEGGRGRNLRVGSTSNNRRTRSMSPLRSPRFQWQSGEGEQMDAAEELQSGPDLKEETARAPELGSSSSSSSGSRSSKWIFLKDLLLHRSKSEGSGRGNGKEKERFWRYISFSQSSKSTPPSAPASAATPPPPPAAAAAKPSRRPASGVGRRRGTSAHERLYTTNRAQAEEMRRRTFLPYRQGLLGCLGFTSRSYGAFNGLARVLNPVTSR